MWTIQDFFNMYMYIYTMYMCNQLQALSCLALLVIK